MFDALIREVAAKFGLGGNAGWILSALLGLMFKKTPGGLGAFLDIFKQKGLASLASSWLGGKGQGEPLAINAAQLENALGGGLISEVISKTGLGKGPVGMALAFMLPKIVRALTPDGTIPTSIPAALSQYLGEEKPAAAAPARPAPAPHTPPPPEPARGGFQWWWLLIPLILFLGWCMMRKPAEPPKPVEAPAPAPVAKTNAKLMLGWDADKLSACSGTVDNDTSKTSIMDALKAAFGAETACEVAVDANTNAANWSGQLAEFLPLLKMNGVKLGFDGDDVTLEGADLPAEGLNALIDKLKALFGDKFKSMAAAAAAAAAAPEPAAVEDPAKKLEEMAAAGNVKGEDLVQVLNMATINFASGSAQISPDSMGILEKAAAAIKAAAGTRIEIGGHTDNVGKPESNMKLSTGRAEAVVAALVKMGVDAGALTAKGYGDTKPKADNTTPEGRAVNRRMEFTLL